MSSFHTIPGKLLERRVTVHLAGCGGNGSQVLTGLARLDRALRSCGHPGGLHVTAFDPDEVTEANVGRQLFYPNDVGRNKATVLIERLNLCFGLDWHDRPARYTGPEERESILGPGSRTWVASEVLITCVDSAQARREIHTSITAHHRGMSATPIYWLDLGNRQTDGQVILGQPLDALSRSFNADRLPTVVEIFPELLDPHLKEDNRPSCSLAEALESQDLFVNQHLATWALQLLWTLFRRGKIAHHGAFINLVDGTVNPLPVPKPKPEPIGQRVRVRARG